MAFDPKKYYGLNPMTLDEELVAPGTIRNTRRCKIEIIDWCAHMTDAINTIRRDALVIPELDDEKHAALVEEFRNRVHRAMEMLNDTAMFGRN